MTVNSEQYNQWTKKAYYYSATSNNMKLVHWPLVGGLLHLVQRGGDWAGPQPAQAPPCCTKCNSPPINGQCTSHRNLPFYPPGSHIAQSVYQRGGVSKRYVTVYSAFIVVPHTRGAQVPITQFYLQIYTLPAFTS